MAERAGAPDAAGPPRAPRWVKVFVVIAAGLVVLILAVKALGSLVGGGLGEHGPGRHSGAGYSVPAGTGHGG